MRYICIPFRLILGVKVVYTYIYIRVYIYIYTHIYTYIYIYIAIASQDGYCLFLCDEFNCTCKRHASQNILSSRLAAG